MIEDFIKGLKQLILKEGLYLILVGIMFLAVLYIGIDAQNYEKETWEYYNEHLIKLGCTGETNIPRMDVYQLPFGNFTFNNSELIGVK